MGRRRKAKAVGNVAPTAVAYIRVSTEEQVNLGVSLEAQESRIKAYCAASGLNLVALFRDEGVSAGLPLERRPQGAQMLRTLEAGKASSVIAVKLDRLFRNTLDCLANVESWDRQGTTLHLLDLSVNTSTAAGRAFLQMAAAFAEMERNLIRERTEGALAHKRANRQVYNHVPYGFDRQGKALLPNAAEQDVIRRIREMDANGVPMLHIAATLTTERIPTKRGGHWYASTVRAILNNPIHRLA